MGLLPIGASEPAQRGPLGDWGRWKASTGTYFFIDASTCLIPSLTTSTLDMILEGILSNPHVCWWMVGGSNPRPPHCERGALPAELTTHSYHRRLGLETERKLSPKAISLSNLKLDDRTSIR